MFNRIYIELSNICNLSCSFCSKDKREKSSLSVKSFEHILKNIKPYTNLIYLHIKGEPLLYKDLDEVLNLTNKYDINVKITTNGVLLNKIIDILNKYKNIKQINISLQCEHNDENYYEKVFDAVNKLNTNIVYRVWTLNDLNEKNPVIDKVLSYYKVKDSGKNIKLKENIYLDKDILFTWPNEGKKVSNRGKCYGSRTHIGILSNGEVVPCCLDSEGIMSFGNIFNESLEDILNSEKFIKFRENMQKGIMDNPLCKACNYKERLK